MPSRLLPLRPVCLFLILVSVLVSAKSNSQAQVVYTVLYSFGPAPDGEEPSGTLVRDSEGNLYGTTSIGGTHGYGTVFKLSESGTETVIYNFAGGTDGADPLGGLILDEDGALYGTTYHGGGSNCSNYAGVGCGTVFKVDKDGEESVLYRFAGIPDGQYPGSETLLRDKDENIYGTTEMGGDSSCNSGSGCGTVFRLGKNGRLTILHTFTGGADGAIPYAGLIADRDGNLYGTTVEGGGFGCAYQGCGTVFELESSGNWKLLHRFQEQTVARAFLDGYAPSAPLLQDPPGNLYGTTFGGGVIGYGTIFELSKGDDQENVLYNFDFEPNATNPDAGLLRDARGNLFGTTIEGGSAYYGTAFELDRAGKLTILHNFSAGKDGGFLRGALIMDESSNLFGTASGGGLPHCGPSGGNGCGVVFKITIP